MRVGDGVGPSRPVVPAPPARAEASDPRRRAAVVTTDSFQVAQPSPWQPATQAALPPSPGLSTAAAEPPASGSTNPKLARFLDEHPDIKTNQDFINYWWKQGGWDGLVQGCRELDISTNDVRNYRSAAIRDLAYPPPPPDGTLPMTAAEADRFHIVQYANPTYNPTGPASSANCGPASLAMVLDTQGKVPPGLTPEQRVDYARALMFPNSSAIKYIEIRGQQVPQLDQDHNTTGNVNVKNGAEEAGLDAEIRSGWDELDQALRDGQPIVAFGDCYEAWKKEFPDRSLYGGGEIGHFIAIVGMTAEGEYIVSDPMYRGGPVEMTREKLAVFFDKDGDNTPGFVAVEPAD
jgi:hypothetical protein